MRKIIGVGRLNRTSEVRKADLEEDKQLEYLFAAPDMINSTHGQNRAQGLETVLSSVEFCSVM